ncbi:MAG: septation protein IspZ [Alphaproteobacteria bacterium]|nr:septation protein IspZ [Alphaproteobacteria bacterium]
MTFAQRYLNRRILLELFPAAVFLVVNFAWGLMPATAAVMAATALAVVVGLAMERRVPILALVTLVLVLVLGGASLALDDAVFIKIKPTVGKCLFAAALGIGLFFRPSFLARALDGQVALSDRGWRILTICWIALALSLAGLNELIWRTLDVDIWATFKAGMTPVSIVGYIAITRVIAPRYWQEATDNRAGG